MARGTARRGTAPSANVTSKRQATAERASRAASVDSCAVVGAHAKVAKRRSEVLQPPPPLLLAPLLLTVAAAMAAAASVVAMQRTGMGGRPARSREVHLEVTRSALPPRAASQVPDELQPT